MGELTHFPVSQWSLSTGAWKLLPRSPPEVKVLSMAWERGPSLPTSSFPQKTDTLLG